MLTGVPVLKVISSKCHVPMILTFRNIDTIRIACWGTKHYAHKTLECERTQTQNTPEDEARDTDSKGLCDGISAYFSLVSAHYSE